MNTGGIFRRTDFGLFFCLLAFFWAIVLIGVMQKNGFTPKTVYWLIQPGESANPYGWKLAQYKMNYAQYGFVKRGLIANLFHGLPQPYWHYSTLVFNALVISGLGAFSAYFILAVRKMHGAGACTILAGTFFLSSLSVVNIGADFGRFDYVNFLLLLLTLTLIRRGRIWLPAALTVMALLIHEAYFFYGVPLVVLYALDRRLDNEASLPIALFGLWPLAIAIIAPEACLKLFGRYEPGPAALADGIQLPENADALLVWTRAVTDNFRLVGQRWRENDFSGFDIATILLVVICTIALMLRLARHMGMRRLSLLAPLFVLPLYGIGTDYARWTELFYLTGFITLGLAILDERIPIGTLNSRYIQFLLIALILLPTIPFGTVYPMEILYAGR